MGDVAWRADRSEELDLDRLRAFFEEYRKECGGRVRQRRKALRLTQPQLGELVGVPFQTISKVETGQIDARDYLKAAIAIRLAMEVDDLFPWPNRRVLEVAA